MKPVNTTFWTNDPTILFHKNYILELWPTEQMKFEQKMNAITRLIILVSLIGFIFTHNTNLLVIAVITIVLIYSIYNFRKKRIITEGFNIQPVEQQFLSSKLTPAPATTTNPVTLETLLKSDFHPTTKKNPFGNVLLTDIMDNPDRKAAAPAFNPDVYDDINRAVKKQTQMLNPSIENTNKQIYGDLKDNYDLDNSMQRFYSTANTRVENNQGAYAQYLYGSMYSAKESSPEGAWMRMKDNFRYINP
jgi:hypothetical protein